MENKTNKTENFDAMVLRAVSDAWGHATQRRFFAGYMLVTDVQSAAEALVGEWLTEARVRASLARLESKAQSFRVDRWEGFKSQSGARGGGVFGGCGIRKAREWRIVVL